MDRNSRILIIAGAIALVALLLGSKLAKVVDAGHVGVAKLFGEVEEEAYQEGLQIPVNPFLEWTLFDARQKTMMETVNVPTQDQMQVRMEISVQYRLIADMAPQILKNTGTLESTVKIHLVPKLREALRVEGKKVSDAKEFFKKETVQSIQQNLLAELGEYLKSKGLEVQDVLIRDITLPPTIMEAISRKKEMQQEAERAVAELQRKEVDARLAVISAQADKNAALQRAEQEKILADAESYRIRIINDAIANNESYLQLQAIEALKAIAADRSATIYFTNGGTPQPMPLLHMGQGDK